MPTSRPCRHPDYFSIQITHAVLVYSYTYISYIQIIQISILFGDALEFLVKLHLRFSGSDTMVVVAFATMWVIPGHIISYQTSVYAPLDISFCSDEFSHTEAL